MSLKRAIASADVIQKTWIPEGTEEYKRFKHVTQENQKLVSVIKRHIFIGKGLVLDVGGRKGDVAFGVTHTSAVHIVDPDPTLRFSQKPGRFWNKKIQDVQFEGSQKYKVIIACHVLGYLGLQEVQQEVVQKLLDQLMVGGTLVLFYNTNQGYMSELLEYSRHIMPVGHYDYFDERILERYRLPTYEIKHIDVAFALTYGTYADLARCCWFLFGSIDPDITGNAKKFLPKLKQDLLEPTFVIDERITFITKKPDTISVPTIR